DLRNNGGGSLNEAIELSALFIGNGPVVQQRDARGRVRVETSSNASVAWDGQLGVLINRHSASASEIFAAAMQDYGRGLIIGEPSYGKGTVQTVVNLDSMARSEDSKLGEVKMTIAQFYRVNGGTTQLRGVVPDISFPTYADPESGESGFDNALAWGTIDAASYEQFGDLSDLAGLLQMKHERRIADNLEFKFLKEDIAEYLQRQNEKTLSLNEQTRRKEREVREAKLKAREVLRAKNKAQAGTDMEEVRQDDGLQANERSLKEELAAEKARKLATDFVLEEAAHVLSDGLGLMQSSTRLAQQAISKASRAKQESGAVTR
ncbi:MAG: tail-specific protease, partial [Burkholderiales bacterium PBB4]